MDFLLSCCMLMTSLLGKVMVGHSGGKMIVNSGKWVCGKGVQANSVQCTAQYE